jgi:hypothetical protein
MSAAGDGSVMVAWTDVSELAPRLRVSRIRIETGE